MPRPAMRILHSRLSDHHHRRAGRESGTQPGPGRGNDRREPVPLHGVSEHRRCRAAGSRTDRCRHRSPAGAAVMVTRYIGKPVRRVEDLRLITGNGRYTDDIGEGTGALEAAFVRSPHAHARIGEIDVIDALDVPGVMAIYTHEDLEDAAAEPLPVLIPHPSMHAPRTGYALAKDVVHHVGEPIAMVVAESRSLAEDAAALIDVEYRQLPAVVGIPAARAADHAVHRDIPDNIAAHL